jgi:DNA-binding NarL/FixJ family response regulator
MSLLPVRANVAEPATLVVCGDILPQKKLLKELQPALGEITVVRCSEEPGTLSLCQRLGASLLLARQGFIAEFPSSELAQLADYGKGTHIVAVLESDSLDASAEMVRRGCRGVLPVRFSATMLRRAVLAVLDGQIFAPSKVIAAVLSDLLKATSRKEESSLTPQEERILDLTAKGYKNSAIAEALFISPSTVRWHKRRLYRKIGGAGKSKYPPSKTTPRNSESATG